MNNNLYYTNVYDSQEYYRTNCSCEPISYNRNNDKFYNENEGFIKGNTQKSIYNPYRNYNPSMPTVSNDKERLILEIQKYGFYLIDLGLYLDVNPTDKEALKLFNENRVKYLRLIEEFNRTYYPLMFVDSNNTTTYKWLEGKFPMERGN